MNGIEILDRFNRLNFYKELPMENKDELIYKRVKSLNNSSVYYITNGCLKDRSLNAYVLYNDSIEYRKVFYWELENDCYIDNDFTKCRLDQII